MASEQMIVNVGANTSGFASAFRGLPGIAKGPLAAVAGSIAAVGAALAVTAVKGIKEFAQFSEGVAKFGVMLNTVEKKQLPAFRAGIRKAATEFGKGIDELNKGMFDVVSSGFRGAEAMDVFRESTKLSVAGAADMAKSTSAIISLMKVYGDELEDASEASDFFFQTQLQARSSIEEMADTFGRLLPTAKAAGVELNALGAMFSTVTLGGKSTAEAVTGLDALLLSMAAKTERVAQRWKDAGVETRNADKSMRDITEIVREMAGLDLEQLRRLIPEKEALNAFIILRDNIEQFPDMLQNVTDKAGATGRALAEMAKEPAQRWRQLQAELNEIFLKIGERWIETFGSSVKTTIDLINFMNDDINGSFNATGLLISRIGSGIATVFKAAGTGVMVVFNVVFEVLALVTKQWSDTFEFLLSTLHFFVAQAAAALNQIPGIDIDPEPLLSTLQKVKRGAEEVAGGVTNFLDGMAKRADEMAIITGESMQESLSNTFASLASGASNAGGKIEELVDTGKAQLNDLSDAAGEAGKNIGKAVATDTGALFGPGGNPAEAFANNWLAAFSVTQQSAVQTANEVVRAFTEQGGDIGPKMAEAMVDSLLEVKNTLGKLSAEQESVLAQLMGVDSVGLERLREGIEESVPEILEEIQALLDAGTEEQDSLLLKALGLDEEGFEELQEKLTGFQEFTQELGESIQETFTAGLASFLEAAILNAENMKQVIDGIMRSIIATIVGAFAKMAVTWLLNKLIFNRIEKKKAKAAGEANIGQVFSGQFAAMSSAPFPVNLTAPIVAQAMAGLAAAGIPAASAVGGAAAGGAVTLATGGIVNGPGGVDNVPAMLTAGEGVLTPDTTSSILSDLLGPQPVGESPPLAGGGGGNTFIFQIEGDSLDTEGLADKLIPFLEQAFGNQTFSLQAGQAR